MANEAVIFDLQLTNALSTWNVVQLARLISNLT